MNFDYSEDELLIKDQARRFLAKNSPSGLSRELLDGRGNEAACALWAEISALGWPGVAIPEAYGGAGMGHVALCALAEEIGRAAAPLPMFGSVYVVAEALLLAGSEAQKQRFLPLLARGALIGTAALSDHGTAHYRAGRLHGTISPAPAGLVAGIAVVAVAGENAVPELLLVDLGQTDITRHPLATIDDTLPHAELMFEHTPAERLGAPGDGPMWIARLQARAAVLLAFEQLGGADACLEMARAYALERRSFGRVIASYQAIKHKLADIYIKNELARSNAYYSAWALSENAAQLELAAATARLSATEAFEFAASENIQVHGGMGYTWEADCHLYYRRARMLAHALGPAAQWRERLVRALEQRNIN